eukprot:1160191-Pelagomonas_calceolata.AAC.2
MDFVSETYTMLPEDAGSTRSEQNTTLQPVSPTADAPLTAVAEANGQRTANQTVCKQQSLCLTC